MELMIDYARVWTHTSGERNWNETFKKKQIACLRHAQDFDSLQDHTQNCRKMIEFHTNYDVSRTFSSLTFL